MKLILATENDLERIAQYLSKENRVSHTRSAYIGIDKDDILEYLQEIYEENQRAIFLLENESEIVGAIAGDICSDNHTIEVVGPFLDTNIENRERYGLEMIEVIRALKADYRLQFFLDAENTFVGQLILKCNGISSGQHCNMHLELLDWKKPENIDELNKKYLLFTNHVKHKENLYYPENLNHQENLIHQENLNHQENSNHQENLKHQEGINNQVNLSQQESLEHQENIKHQIEDLHNTLFPTSYYNGKTIMNSLDEKHYVSYGIEEGTVVSYAYYNTEESGYLEFIGTNPTHRCKGHATLLLMHICDFLRMQNCTKISLCVGYENKEAIRVYENVGFVITEINQSYVIEQ